MRTVLAILFFVAAIVEAQHLQDPTKPSGNTGPLSSEPNQMNTAAKTLVLTAIMIKENHKQAIINGQSVEEGQLFQNYQVVSISQHKVVLSGAKGEQSLVMNKNNVKKDINHDF